jgi:hypothetical protein
MGLREAIGGSAMALSQFRQTFGKRLTRAIGVYAEEAANLNFQADNVAIRRCITKLPEISTMDAFRFSGARGATGASAIGHRAHENRFPGNNKLVNQQKSRKKTAKGWMNGVLDHLFRIGEPADFSCASFEPREVDSRKLRENLF